MPATGVTTGVPSAATMSWPWWTWPVRPGAEARAGAAEAVRALDREDPLTGARPAAARAPGAGGGAGAVTSSVSRPEARAVRRSVAPRGPVACSRAV